MHRVAFLLLALSTVGCSAQYMVALELDGVFMGWLRSASGGGIVADVLLDGADPPVQQKHIGPVKYEDIQFSFDASMSPKFYDWLQTYFRKGARRSGAIVAADYNRREVRRITFTDGLITEITFPAVDAASKATATGSVTLSVASSRMQSSSGIQLKYDDTILQKRTWLAANFRFTLGSLDTTRVTSIGPLTLKFTAATGIITTPTIALTASEVGSQSLLNWVQTFINRGTTTELTASLTFYDSVLKPFYVLDFSGVGAFHSLFDSMQSSSESIRRITPEFYCEDIRFTYSRAT